MKFTSSIVVGCALVAPIAALPAKNINGGPGNFGPQATPTGRLAARQQANEINALLSLVPAVETALGVQKRNPQDIVLVSGSSTSTLKFTGVSGATVTPTTIVLGKRQVGVTISGLSGTAGSVLSALATATDSAGSVLSALAKATPTISVARRQVGLSGSAIDSLLSIAGVAASAVATPSVSLVRRQGGASTPISSSGISALEGVLGDLVGGVVKRQSSGQGEGSQGGKGNGTSGSTTSSSGSNVLAGATLDGFTLQLIDKRQNAGNGQGGNGQSGNGQSGSSSSSTTQTATELLNDILKLINKRAVTLESRQLFNASNIPGNLTNLTNTTITITI